MSDDNQIIHSTVNDEKDKKFRMQATVFLTSVAGIAAATGFGKSLLSARKADPTFFNKGMVGARDLTETGAQLAMKALGWGTLYAFLGTGVFCFGVWKLSGATNISEFRQKMGSALPRIPKNDPPQSRTEFEGLTDLMTYISTWTKE